MKTFSHILRYILVAAALASCQRTDDSVAEPVVSESFTATIESFEDQTRTALDGKYAVWTSGDEIAVFQGRSTADRYVLYDLKVSSFRLAERAEDEGDAFEANVALYPYSESLTCEETDAGYKIDNISFPSVQQYKENSFSEESFFMAALTAGLEDRVLDFRNICGGLRLYITGEKNVEINKIVLSGNDDERLAGVGSVTCDSEGNVSFNGFTGSASERQISLNCDGIKLDEQDASQFIISLPPVIFSKGFTVTLNAKVDGADVTYTRSTDKPHTIRKSTFLSMPSFVFGEVPPEPALDVSPSSLTFAAEGGEQKVTLSSNQDWTAIVYDSWLSVSPSYGIGSSESVTVIVNVISNESEFSRAGQVVFASRGLSRTLTVEQEGFVPPSKEGDYIDEYGVNHGPGVEIDGVVWAPVNCGYHKDDFKYGKLYQWGRKYGQGYSGGLYDLGGYYIGTYSDSEVPSKLTGPVSLSTGQSKANEDKFYYNSSSPYDWCSSPDDKLWNSGTEENPVKAEYDPCPEGWRVPTYAELDELRNNYSSLTTADNGQMGIWFSGPNSYTASVPQVFFPAAGDRSYYDGDANSRGKFGGYWSSRPDSGAHAYGLYFFSSIENIGLSRRAYGYSVRCVQATDEVAEL